MHEFGVGRPHIAIAAIEQAQAEVQVVMRNRQGFVHAAHLLVKISADRSARGDQRGHVLSRLGAPGNSTIASLVSNVGTVGRTVHTQDHAGMLDGPVRVQQHRCDQSNAWLQCTADQLVKPVWTYHFNVVIHQDDDRATRPVHTEIAFGCVIERSGERHDGHTLIAH